MSTPYNGGEETKMQTRHHKQTTLPDTSYEEIPLLSDFMDKDKKQTKFEKAKDLIRRKSPTVNFEKMCPIDFSKKGSGIYFLEEVSGVQRTFLKLASRSLGRSHIRG